MSDLTRFIKYELSYAIHDHLKNIFGLDFKKLPSGKLICNTYLSGEKTGKADKLCVTTAKPWNIIQNSSESANDIGGKSISFVDLYCKENGLNKDDKRDFLKAVRELCEACGIPFPEFSEEAARAFREREEKQEKLKNIADRMNAQLLSGDEAAAPAYRYLTEVRRYTRPFIEWAGLGFATPQDAKELRELMGTTFPAKVGESYVLAIPECSRGEITGFRFRNMGTGGDKYKAVFIDGKETNRFHLYGFEPGDIPVRDGLKDLLVVEGQLDALRVKYEDIPGVVAIGRDGISDEAIAEAREYGVQSFTLLFDRDVDENGNHKDNSRAVQNAVGRIRAAGLSAFIATFPDEDGQKVDADEYLKRHTGAEFQEIVNARKSAVMYFFERTAKKYKGENYDHVLTDPEREAFRAEVVNLFSETGTTPIERRTIAERYASYLGGGVTPEDAAAEIAEVSSLRDIATEKANTESKRAGLKRMAKRIEYMIENGDTLGAIAYAYNEITRLNDEKKKTTIGENAFKQCSFEEILEELKSEPEGLHTGITLFNPNASNPMEASEELIIPAGQLTYVAAPSSHGKSRMMENLALYIAAEDKEPGNVLYFSLEESKASVMVQFLNLYHNEELSLNNCKTIKEYLKTGSTTHFKHGASISRLQESIKNFSKLMNSGKLQIYYPGRDTTAIIENIIEKHKENPVKAVFIDYVQILHQGDGYGSKKEMIMQICLSLMPVAVESGIPIILGAQFNREVRTPLDMDLNKLGDASDIEQSANTLIMMFGSWKKKTNMGKNNNYLDGGGKLTPEGEALLARGFEPGKFGKLYVELGKNRGGIVGLNAVLDFNGNTGKIQNSAEDRGPETEAAEPVTGSSTKRDPDDIFGE